MRRAELAWALDPSTSAPVPAWYPVFQVAREAGITPWALEEAPAEWVARLFEIHRIRSSIKRG